MGQDGKQSNNENDVFVMELIEEVDKNGDGEVSFIRG